MLPISLLTLTLILMSSILVLLLSLVVYPEQASTSIKGVNECYYCERARDLNDCNRIKTCQQDEVCIVEQEVDANNITTYTKKCTKAHPCIEVTAFRIQNENIFSLGFLVGKRNSLTSCSVCCGGQLCNTGGCFQLVKKLRLLWKAGSLDTTSLTYMPPALSTSSIVVTTKPGK